MKEKKIARKDFLVYSGVILTVPAFLQFCGTTQNSKHAEWNKIDNREDSVSESGNIPILNAIQYGITAPNPHNTQAWKFRIISPVEMFLYVDEKRILPETDPPTRQIHIGQGTFLEHLSIGANHLGYSAKINLFPEGDYALADTGKKSVAHIVLSKKSSPGHGLFHSIQTRSTNRSVYFGNQVTGEEEMILTNIASPKHCSMNFILKEDEMEKYKRIFLTGSILESTTYSKNDESRIWFRFSDSEIQKYRDGISLPGNGITGIKRWFTESFFLDKTPEKYHSKNNTEAYLALMKKVIDSSKGFVFFKTRTNTKMDWVLAGMDYARFHLAVTSIGMQMSPLSQVLQEFSEMKPVRKEFEDMTKTKEPEKIQMIARLGRSDYRFFSPRRNPKDMILN